jgi:glycosyltransferase involved in cell wall biosynthesis
MGRDASDEVASATAVSVVVPAHDESRVIAATLRALTEGCVDGELQVVVVCNGCSDDTAEIARSFGSPVEVVETPVASKAAALRLGDERATGFPRFYVDADVSLPLASLRRVAEVLRRGPWLAAAPRMQVDLSGRSWPVRAYYEIWTRLPYHTSGMIGSGVYAMSEEGRSRFDAFPDIISDDGFARLQFAPDERTSVDGATFTIRAPQSLAAVVKIKTRSQKGAVQLLRSFPELAANDVRDYGSSFADILRDPRQWASCCVYLYVILVTKLRAHWLNYSRDLGEWERDDTSRDAAR